MDSSQSFEETPEFRVIVCGGRTFKDYEHVRYWLSLLFEPNYDGPNDESLPDNCKKWWLPRPDLVLIHGYAPGVDAHADDWATVNWVKVRRYAADWKKYGRAAGPIRNKLMLTEGKPHLLVAFTGGAGTEDMKRQARAAGVAVLEIPYHEK